MPRGDISTYSKRLTGDCQRDRSTLCREEKTMLVECPIVYPSSSKYLFNYRAAKEL